MIQYYVKPAKKTYGHPVAVSMNAEAVTKFYCEKCGLVEEYPKNDFDTVAEWHAKYQQLKSRSFTHYVSKCQEIYLSRDAPEALPADLEQTSIFDLLGVT